MRKYLTTLLLVGPILLISIICCTPSLHPLYTNDDLVFEPALLGVWMGTDPFSDSPATWEFTEDPATATAEEAGSGEGGRSYTLFHTPSRGQTGQFSAHLLKLEDKLFLDLYPESEQDESADDFHELYFIPTHSFWYVEQLEPELRLAFIDLDWLTAYLADHPDAVAHELLGEGDDKWTLYTAPTEQLQKFMLSCLEQEGAFNDDSVFVLERADSATAQEMDGAWAEMSIIATLDGKPHGVTVQLWDATGALVSERSTDMHGIDYLTQTPPGTYTLRFIDAAGNYYPAEHTVTLQPGDSLPVVVELTEGPDEKTAEGANQDSGYGAGS